MANMFDAYLFIWLNMCLSFMFDFKIKLVWKKVLSFPNQIINSHDKMKFYK